MAKNGEIGGGRKGVITNRTQFFNSQTGLWQERNVLNGRIINVKTTSGRFKDVRREK